MKIPANSLRNAAATLSVIAAASSFALAQNVPAPAPAASGNRATAGSTSSTAVGAPGGTGQPN